MSVTHHFACDICGASCVGGSRLSAETTEMVGREFRASVNISLEFTVKADWTGDGRKTGIDLCDTHKKALLARFFQVHS